MAMEELVGKTIGSYDVQRELGRGGMGVVYKAHDMTLNRPIALKVLPERLAQSEAFLKRFHREARAVAQLNHPNVVTIYNIGSHAGPEGNFQYIAMEYIKGQTIAEIIEQEGQVPVKRALEIARQAVDALAAAHELQIVHRDVKPHNIMVDGAGRVKVMDFGIAKTAEEMSTGLTKAGDVLGTPTYMSPEQCRGTEVDGRADLYALGIVLFEMLAGKVPFAGETAIVVVQKILFEPPPSILEFNPDVPKSVQNILDKSLAKDLRYRYPSAAEMEADLARALAGEAVKGAGTSDVATMFVETGPIVRLERAFRSRRMQASSGALAFALLAFLAVALTRKKPEPRVSKGDAVANGAPTAAATAAPTPAPSPTAAATPAQILWTDAPEPGAKVPTRDIRLAWKMNNNLISEGFLVGLNVDEPTTKTFDTAQVFKLDHPGPQFVTVIPIIAGGASGERHRREFIFEPNSPPALAASLERTTIRSGQAGRLVVSAEDVDGDEVVYEARIDGGAWSPVRPGGQPLAGLADGFHEIEARAMDSRGLYSAPWSERLHVATPASLIKEVTDLFTGVGGKVDEAKAADLLQREASDDAPLLQMWLAWFYQFGRCAFPKFPEKATALAQPILGKIEALAASGDPDAMFLLGSALDAGIGAAPDKKRAFELVSKAAEAGHTSAMNYLGFLYYGGGDAAKKSPEKAREWFQKAADAGDATGMNNLGNMLLASKKDEKELELAAGWFRKGADLGSPRCMTSLGHMLDKGLGAAKDEAAALALYEKAAALGDEKARQNLDEHKRAEK